MLISVTILTDPRMWCNGTCEKNKTSIPTGPGVHSQQGSMAFLDSNVNNRKVIFSDKKSVTILTKTPP